MGKSYNNVVEMVRATIDEAAADALQRQIESRKLIKALSIARVVSNVTVDQIAEARECTPDAINNLEGSGVDFDLKLADIQAYCKVLGGEFRMVKGESSFTVPGS